MENIERMKPSQTYEVMDLWLRTTIHSNSFVEENFWETHYDFVKEKYINGKENFVYIIDGKIVAGSHGAGGEIGHALVVRDEAEKCNCGNHGCLEQYASATGIVRVAGRMLAASDDDSTLRELQNITAKDVLDAFKAGDAVAVRVMEYVGDLLGGAIAGFATVADPEAIVIGGGVSKAGQPLIDCIEKYYQRYAFPSCKETPIVLATLGNDAGIYGAAKMVL